MEQDDPNDKPRRRLTRCPAAFLAGLAARRCLDACFADLYIARATDLGYDTLPPAKVEAARLAAVRARASR